MAEREASGPFTSLEDFVDRMSNKEVNKRTLENFIKVRRPGYPARNQEAEDCW